MSDPSPAFSPDLSWTAEGAPRSQLYDDIYFSTEGGLAETRAVFLQGCGLPDAWMGRQRFAVAELGFGTGLNILALLDLWRQTRTPGQTLTIFSVEAHPLSRNEASQALAAWPELADLAQALLDHWPRRAGGFHRVDFPELGAVLDVAVAEAGDALGQWTGQADAWFLDGFSPACNPAMWRPEVLALVAARSAPGARLATFTVAAAVREGLTAEGFAVEKQPGFGRKRHRLEARLPGTPAPTRPPATVCILGAGIAGASLARAFRAQGLNPLILDRGDAGASGNPAALAAPGLDAGERAGGRLYAQALARAADLYRQTAPACLIQQGVLQLEQAARDGPRFDRVAASGLFEPGAVTRVDGQTAAERLSEDFAPGGLLLRDALTVEPRALLDAWLEGLPRASGEAARLERVGGRWRVLDRDGLCLAETDVLVLAGGSGLTGLTDLPLEPVRGQATWATGVESGRAAAWGGYAAPTQTGVLFGATHDKTHVTDDIRPEDDARNLKTLAQVRPRLAEILAGRPLMSRAAVRAATPDRLPIAGRLGPGLFTLTGLGSRGFVTAPLLAEHLAALILDLPSPLPADLAAVVDPSRFG